MPNTNNMVEADQFGKKLIESLAQSLNDDRTGREMRFTGGDVTPCLKANGVTIQDDHHWATEQAYKNGYEQGYADALRHTINELKSRYIKVMGISKPVQDVVGADRCVSCGAIVPEGRQVCPNCERGVGDG